MRATARQLRARARRDLDPDGVALDVTGAGWRGRHRQARRRHHPAARRLLSADQGPARFWPVDPATLPWDLQVRVRRRDGVRHP